MRGCGWSVLSQTPVSSSDCLLFLHVKDPHLLPSRAYFDAVAGWSNLSAIHMPSQMCAAADYRRLYGGCGAPVLAFSHLYAAFEGFPCYEFESGRGWRARARVSAPVRPAAPEYPGAPCARCVYAAPCRCDRPQPL